MNITQLNFTDILSNVTDNNNSKDIEEQPSMVLYKITIMLFLFVLTFTFGYLPIRISYFQSNFQLIGIANSFSGGIFLTVALLHLLPESTEIFHEYFFEEKEVGPGRTESFHFPVSFLIAILGYSLILFLEKVMFDHTHSHEEDYDCLEDEDDDPNKDVSVLNVNNNLSINVPDTSLISEKKQRSMMSSSFQSFSKLSRNKKEKIQEYFQACKINYGDTNEENFKQLFSTTGKISKFIINKGKASEKIRKSNAKQYESLLPNNNKTRKSKISGNIDTNLPMQQPKKSNITSYLLLIALSIHATFEGIAIGLRNNGNDIFYMLLAVSFHKWVEALSIGINLNKAKIARGVLCSFILLFALMTPFGIFCGFIFSGMSELLEAFFLSISSGTFLYISASEVVIEEFSVSKYKHRKFLGFIMGAVIIFLLTLFGHH